MNRSGPHPNHENRLIIILTILIRRGGAPSVAAGFIIFGGMGVSTPISNSGRGPCSWEIMESNMTLQGLRPAAEAPRLRWCCVTCTTKVQRISVQEFLKHPMRLRIQRELDWHKGDDHITGTRFSPDQKIPECDPDTCNAIYRRNHSPRFSWTRKKKQLFLENNHLAYASTRSRAVIIPAICFFFIIGSRRTCCAAMIFAAW